MEAVSTSAEQRSFLLQRAQPALSGLIDGSLLSVTLAGVIIATTGPALGSAASA